MTEKVEGTIHRKNLRKTSPKPESPKPESPKPESLGLRLEPRSPSFGRIYLVDNEASDSIFRSFIPAIVQKLNSRIRAAVKAGTYSADAERKLLKSSIDAVLKVSGFAIMDSQKERTIRRFWYDIYPGRAMPEEMRQSKAKKVPSDLTSNRPTRARRSEEVEQSIAPSIAGLDEIEATAIDEITNDLRTITNDIRALTAFYRDNALK